MDLATAAPAMGNETANPAMEAARIGSAAGRWILITRVRNRMGWTTEAIRCATRAQLPFEYPDHEVLNDEQGGPRTREDHQ